MLYKCPWAHVLNVGLLTPTCWKEKIGRKNKTLVNSLHTSKYFLMKREFQKSSLALERGGMGQNIMSTVLAAPASAGAGWIQALQRGRTAFGLCGLCLAARKRDVKKRSFHLPSDTWQQTEERTEARTWAIPVRGHGKPPIHSSDGKTPWGSWQGCQKQTITPAWYFQSEGRLQGVSRQTVFEAGCLTHTRNVFTRTIAFSSWFHHSSRYAKWMTKIGK